MAIEIREIGPDSLEQYGQIPMRHRVESVFRVRVPQEAGG